MSAEDNLRLNDDELMASKICRFGKVVFSHGWNSDSPGSGAGVEYIKEWRGKFAVQYSTEEIAGPYDSFDVALRENNNLLVVGAATEGIECEYMNDTDMTRLLSPKVVPYEDFSEEVLAWIAKMLPARPKSDRLTFTINDELWAYNEKEGFHQNGNQ